MPVKVRCKGCQKVLKAPDKARGKVLKCPDCGERIRVPSGEKKRPKKKKRPAKVEEEDTDGLGFLAGIDLSDSKRIEDRHIKICPKCAVEVDEEDEVCENCGVIIETGQLSDREKRKRERRGPNPADFFPVAWSDPWQFTLNHIPLILRTILFWTFFGTSYLCCMYMSNWCSNIPPKMFWAGLAFASLLGIYGWFFFLQLEIMKLTFAKKKVLKKTKIDPFTAMSLGLKLAVWPLVLMLPFIWFPVFWILPTIAFPIAMTHFSMPYTYKAFLPITMGKQFFKTIGASLYWLLIVMSISVFNLVLIGLAFYYSKEAVVWVLALILKTAALMTLIGTESLTVTAYVCIGIAGIFIFGTITFIVALLSSPVAIYVMRLTGLFGYYNQEKLELKRYQPEGVKAPFGARYMAFLVDRLMAGIFFVAVFGVLASAAWLIMYMGENLPDIDPEQSLEFSEWVNEFLILFKMPLILTALLFGGFIYKYFIGGVTGTSQATLGKHALGLIVTDHKGRRLKKPLAWKRLFYRELLGTFTLGISYLMAAFKESQQTMYDKITQTQVMWKGDDERS